MNSQDIQNLQESYLAVYDDETRENLEFKNWVNNLLDEGYDLSSYNLDELYETYIGEERAEGVRPYKAGPTQAEVRADAKKSEKAKKDKDKDKAGYGPEDKFKSDWKLRAVPSSTSKRKTGETETVSQRMDREAPYKTRPFSPLFTKQGSRTASAVTRATEGPGEPQSVTMPRKKSKPSREIVRKNQINAEFELWVNELLDEGYDLSDCTWDEMYEIYEGRGRWGSDMKRNRSAISSALSGNVWSTHPASRTSSDIKPKQSSRPQSNYRANLSTTDRAELAVTARKERKDGENFDSEYTPSRKKVEKAIKKLPSITKNPKKLRKQAAIGEEFDLYDIILSHLINEGYAETIESAEAIMVNMSEDWRDSIIG